jgi:hypothetical protein
MLNFNTAISALGLEELKFLGNKFTWSNMHSSPLLERLDWFFASVSWFINYLGSSMASLPRDTSDHCPCLISISTDIPKSKTFNFGNYWLLHEEFFQILQNGWFSPVLYADKAKSLGAKFKNLKKVLRAWHAQISNLKRTIQNNKMLLMFLDILEEFRDLSLEEWNMRKIVEHHLKNLLEQERI